MSTDRSLRLQLPRLSFAPTPLERPDAPPGRPGAPGAPGTPGTERDIEAVYAAMLPAGHQGREGAARRFLVTLHADDRAQVLSALLDRLASPADIGKRWHLQGFTLEASLSASFAGIGATAIVVKPVFWRTQSPEALSDQNAADLARDLTATLRAALPADLAGQVAASERPSTLEVRPIERGDEFRLYGGKRFREMRFGLEGTGDEAAARCARVVERFSTALATRHVPLAYLHYPVRWGAGNGRLRWLRMAYAVEGDAATDAGIELAAWAIAEEERAALAAYEPTRPGGMDARFVTLKVGPAGSAGGTDARPSSPPAPHERPRTVALGIDGRARPGLVARVMRELTGARVYGCAMAVLYGHTLCNITVDEASGRLLHERLSAPELELSVAVHAADPRTRIVPRSDDENFAWWVAWCCGDRLGLMRNIVEKAYDVFRDAGVAPPNINYAISRVLADGTTCAGKIQFLCPRTSAAAVGLLPADPRLGEAADREPLGWRALHKRVAEAVAPALTGWEPKNPEWRDEPLQIGEAEPTEQPWAWLVVPEGTAQDLQTVAATDRYWAENIAVTPRQGPPASLPSQIASFAHTAGRRIRRAVPTHVTA